jgi:pectate lyase
MIVLLPEAGSAIPAFPGAEGYGSDTPGGRGGQVLIVTNLNASGPGSFFDALLTSGPRIIVFRVSGVIQGQGETIMQAEQYSYLTVAGQTSPGGVTITTSSGTPIWQYGDVKFHDAIWRHLRFRVGSANDHSFEQYKSHDWIIDHCDFSGGTDECFDLAGVYNITLQWSTVTNSGPTGQRYGALIGGLVYNITMHHNFFANHVKRGPVMHWYGNPAPHNGMVDYRNNVGYNFATHVVRIQPLADTLVYVNMVGNYFKEGPARDSYLYGPVRFTESIRYYLDRNLFDTDRTSWDGGLALCPDTIVDRRFGSNPTRIYTEWNMAPVTTTSAVEARDAVFAKVGAWPRDSMNVRTIREFHARTGALGVCDDPRITGGPNPPDDTDLDGMPDCWEDYMGFNPDSAADNKGDHDGDGYTNIEEYINDLALALAGETPHNGLIENGCPTGIEAGPAKASAGMEIMVSPNPFHTAVAVSVKTLHFQESGSRNGKCNVSTVSIYDTHGRMVHRANTAAGRYEWNAAGFPAGVYLLKVTASGQTLTKRLFLQKYRRLPYEIVPDSALCDLIRFCRPDHLPRGKQGAALFLSGQSRRQAL